MNPDTSNNQSLKYQRFTLSGCKNISNIKLEFVAKTQFLCFPPLNPFKNVRGALTYLGEKRNSRRGGGNK